MSELKKMKLELNFLVKETQNLDYLSYAELDHQIVLAQRILALGGKL
jgi:hypothetical protein